MTDEQVKLAAEMHFDKRMNLGEVGKVFGVHGWTIGDNIIRRLGMKPREAEPKDGPTARSFDADKWTNEHSYWLGLLHADGHATCGSVALGLKSTDSYLVEQFARFCHYSGKIQVRKAKTVLHNNGKHYNHSEFHTCRIGSILLAKSLMEKGIRTGDKTVWDVPCGVEDYIRGMFDGNGSIGRNKDGQWRMAYYGRLETCQFIEKFLSSRGVNVKPPIPDRNIYRLYILAGQKTENIKLATSILYDRPGTRMKRKDVFSAKADPSTALQSTPVVNHVRQPSICHGYKIFGT